MIGAGGDILIPRPKRWAKKGYVGNAIEKNSVGKKKEKDQSVKKGGYGRRYLSDQR